MEGIGDIGINGPLLIAFVVNFLILFGLLSVVLYKPVMKKLDERQAIIKESMDQAEQIKQQTARTEEDIKARLETARKEGQQVIAQAEQIGERIKSEAKDAARKEAESLIAKSQIEIQQQREKDLSQLRSQFADIAILAAEKVIKETLDKDKHQHIIDDVLRESSTFNKG
jgi:F-type H+-transporting ATPase subunit b